MTAEMLSKIGMNHRIQENGEKYQSLVGIIEHKMNSDVLKKKTKNPHFDFI